MAKGVEGEQQSLAYRHGSDLIKGLKLDGKGTARIQ